MESVRISIAVSPVRKWFTLLKYTSPFVRSGTAVGVTVGAGVAVGVTAI